jgi:outer membrane protein assembly factor BamB
LKEQRIASSAVKGILSIALLGGVVTAAAMLAGCGGRAENAAPVSSGFVPINPPALLRAWKVNLGLSAGVTVEALHLTDEYLFAYASDDRVYAFDRNSGSQLFSMKVGHGSPRAPVVTRDQIVIPSESTLEVFDRRGRFVRSINLGYTTRTDAVFAAGRIAIGVDTAGRGRMLFIDPTKQYPDVTPILTMGGLNGRPAVRGGLVYVGAEDGKVYSISEDLVAAWALPGGAFQTDGRIVADLVADPGPIGNVYVASTDTKLYALVALTGQIRWQFYAGAPLDQGPMVTADSVYQYIPGSGVAAIDKAGTGGNVRTAKWTVPDASKVLAEDAQFTYLVGTENRIYGVDRKTGRLRFQSERNDFRQFAQNTKDGTIFAATPKGEIVAAVPVLTGGKRGEIVMGAVKVDEVAVGE